MLSAYIGNAYGAAIGVRSGRSRPLQREPSAVLARPVFWRKEFAIRLRSLLAEKSEEKSGRKKGPHSFCVGVDIFGVKKGKKSLRWVKKNGIPANPHSFRKTTPLERVQELKRTSLVKE